MIVTVYFSFVQSKYKPKINIWILKINILRINHILYSCQKLTLIGHIPTYFIILLYIIIIYVDMV